MPFVHINDLRVEKHAGSPTRGYTEASDIKITAGASWNH